MFVTFKQWFSDVGEGEKENIDEFRAHGARWIRLTLSGSRSGFQFLPRIFRPAKLGPAWTKRSPCSERQPALLSCNGGDSPTTSQLFPTPSSPPPSPSKSIAIKAVIQH